MGDPGLKRSKPVEDRTIADSGYQGLERSNFAMGRMGWVVEGLGGSLQVVADWEVLLIQAQGQEHSDCLEEGRMVEDCMAMALSRLMGGVDLTQTGW